MSSINQVVLTGRVSQAPELRHSKAGLAVVRLSIAVEAYSKSAENNKICHFIDVTVWGATAITAEKHLSVGRMVGVTGRLEISVYPDKETGKEQRRLKVVGEKLTFLDSAPKTEPEAIDPHETEYATGMAEDQCSTPAPVIAPVIEGATAPASEPLPEAPPAYLGKTRKNAKK